MNSKSTYSISAIVLTAMTVFADPPAPTVAITNSPCMNEPTTPAEKTDTVKTRLDSGFVLLFNGKDKTGWWENCGPHSADKVNGGTWLVDPSQGILYSRNEGGNGGIFVTRNTFKSYEIIFDLWPTFGNDGGVFNRVTKAGKNWQTTIDYISGSGVAGSFNEGGWAPGDINHDPFRFGGSGPSSPSTPTGIANWTDFTKTLSPTGFGCSEGGCVAADFPKIWDINGWNQMRVKFYDGLEVGRSVIMETFIRKLGAPAWVPVYKKSQVEVTKTAAVVTPEGPVAFQIHGGDRWKAGSFNAYRNIKIRPLNIDGTPVTPFPPADVVGVRDGLGAMPSHQITIANGLMTGVFKGVAEITVVDTRGKVVEKFTAQAGNFSRELGALNKGLMIATIKDDQGVSQIRFSRI